MAAAFSSAVPPRMASGEARERPASSGAIVYDWMASSFSSHTCVGAAMETSSMPSSPCTTSAWREPSRCSTCAIFSPSAPSATPSTCRCAPAGLVSGPRMLNTVRIPISLRGGPANRMAGWNAGANMKPTPTSRRHRSTLSGPRSILTPAASSTSALPAALVMARLPCLATRRPAPTATSAAMVETLMECVPSPPVPQVSTRSPSTLTRRALSRMTRAMPAISSAVSPLMRSAVTNAPNWAGVASPVMIDSMTPEACSSDRFLPATRSAIACCTMLALLLYWVSRGGGLPRRLRASGSLRGRVEAATPVGRPRRRAAPMPCSSQRWSRNPRTHVPHARPPRRCSRCP